MSRLRIAVDFDGVLHSYTTLWQAPHIIPDPPVLGAVEWWNEMQRYFNMYVHTTRAQTLEGIEAIQQWMKANWFEFATTTVITAHKLPATVYVDDRGYRFTGANFPTKEDIYNLKPWFKEGWPNATNT